MCIYMDVCVCHCMCVIYGCVHVLVYASFYRTVTVCVWMCVCVTMCVCCVWVCAHMGGCIFL